MLRAHAWLRTATILGYLIVPPSPYSLRRSIAARLTIVTTQHPTSAEDFCLQRGPFAEATYLFLFAFAS